MLPWFFRHYDPLVDQYFIYDDGSTDQSLALLHAHPKVTLLPMPSYACPESRIESGRILQDSCWHASRGKADWVIVTDIDEHLYHPDIHNYLRRMVKAGVSMIPALGYEMIADAFPDTDGRLCDLLVRGVPSPFYSKLNIFSPNLIETTGYEPGRHTAAPTGHVLLPAKDELKLLHFKHIDFDRLCERHKQYLTRQRPQDLAMGWGGQYSWSDAKLKATWDLLHRKATNVLRHRWWPWQKASKRLWWKHYPRDHHAQPFYRRWWQQRFVKPAI
ncbi:glycosyltransferase family 2 protein [Leeia oryzae]|uniref:glycosyltransferase family 2 protein n=1 Tax=Leeia oryzae TaxID=356662 RepID=UPI00037E4107|nr:glycosyltransferase family 2 protein [Leeia oryzae]